MSKQRIFPSIWFDRQAKEASEFYMSLFQNSREMKVSYYGKEGHEIHGMEEGTVLTVDFELDDNRFTALNGGPHFIPNPSITFFVTLETTHEVDEIWSKLLEGGQEMMPLDKYPWSDRYGWLSDRYGVSWQIYLGKLEDVGQRITPLLFFTGNQRGRAEEAHDFYLSVFPNSYSDGVAKYEPGEGGPEGMVKHSQFKLDGQTFMAMDSAVENDFPFNEAISMVVSCNGQEEVDYYWENLLKNGGSEQQCGWLKDRFGVSWQIVPDKLDSLLNNSDKERSERVMKAMLQMKKLDINKLEKA